MLGSTYKNKFIGLRWKLNWWTLSWTTFLLRQSMFIHLTNFSIQVLSSVSETGSTWCKISPYICGSRSNVVTPANAPYCHNVQRRILYSSKVWEGSYIANRYRCMLTSLTLSGATCGRTWGYSTTIKDITENAIFAVVQVVVYSIV